MKIKLNIFYKINNKTTEECRGCIFKVKSLKKKFDELVNDYFYDIEIIKPQQDARCSYKKYCYLSTKDKIKELSKIEQELYGIQQEN